MKIVAPKSYYLSTCCVKILKEKNKYSIHSELPKISMLPKNVVWSFEGSKAKASHYNMSSPLFWENQNPSLLTIQ